MLGSSRSCVMACVGFMPSGSSTRLFPSTRHTGKELAAVRSQLWELYADLKAYKAHPSPAQKIDLEARFDALFTTQTSFETLNQTLRRTHHNKAELLLVLDRPDIALHTNGSERDLRDPVKKRKVSGGDPSDRGRPRLGNFTGLEGTFPKAGGSFLEDLA